MVDDITKRQRAEEALRESEERYRLLIERQKDGLCIVDLEERFVFCNPAGEEIFGVPRGGLVGRNVREFTTPETFELIRRQTGNRRSGESSTYELEIIRPDGERRQLLTTATPWLDKDGRVIAALAIFRDETNRKRVEREIRWQADLLQKTFDSMTDAIFILEAKAPPIAPTILECNEAASAVFGYDRTEMLGKTTDFLHVSEENLREFQSQLYAAVQQGRLPFHLHEFRMRRKDASIFPSEHSVSQLLNDKGERTGWVSIVRDITERRRMEEEIRSLARFPSENPNPILRLDRHGTVLTANEASKALLQEWGSGIGQIAPKFWRDLVSDALSSGQSKNVDVDFGGKSYTFLVKPVMEADYVNLYGRDITERKRLEEAIRRRAEELAALQATVLDITAQHDLQMLLQLIVERATKMLRGYSGGMYLCDPERKELRLAVSYNPPRDYTGTVLKYGEGAAGVVVETGKPLIIDDYRTWPGRAALYDAQLFTGVLTVPMVWHSRVTGTIYILDNVETRRFTEADQELLSLFANHAAIAVENTRLMEQNRRHTTELEQLVFERTKNLAESERRFRELADLLPQIVFQIDEKGNLTFLNHAGFASTGHGKDDLRRGLNAFQMFAPEDHDRARQKIRKLLGGEKVSSDEYAVLRKDGSTFPAIVFAAPVMRENRAVGVRGIVVDITERKRLEAALAKSQRLATIGELAAMVGHDLRNPLQGIATTLYLAKKTLKHPKTAKKQDAVELLEMLDGEVYYMNKIVSDLQDYAAPLTAKFVPTDAAQLIRSTLATIGVPTNVKVAITTTKGIQKAELDGVMMRRVFTNLVTNAIQGMPKGGKLTIETSTTGKELMVSFRDTGVGIPEENFHKLFELFFTTKAKGQGLGLPVCKRLVEAQGGTITVQSKVGEGSTFTVKLPLKRQ